MPANAKKAPTKAELFARIAEDTGLTRKDIAAVFDSLNVQVRNSLDSDSGPGAFTIPGLLKLNVVTKPASKAVKATPLKALRDMVER